MTCEFDGIEEISRMLADLGDQAESVAARCLYEGAGVMADEIQLQAQGIQTAPFAGKTPEGTERLPSPEEKQIILDAGVGIAKFDKNGSEVNTSVGYNGAGYAEPKWHTSRSQIAVGQVANAVNSGTSFMRKQPFIRRASSQGGKRAEDAIVREMESLIADMTKGG